MTVKAFVLDTNVLLHSAQSIESFHDNDVVIPMAVVEELDKFKKNSDELGRNARQVIRRLDKLRQAAGKPGQLRRGVPLSAVSASATGRLFVLSAAELGNGEMDSKIREVFRLDLGGDGAVVLLKARKGKIENFADRPGEHRKFGDGARRECEILVAQLLGGFERVDGVVGDALKIADGF